MKTKIKYMLIFALTLSIVLIFFVGTKSYATILWDEGTSSVPITVTLNNAPYGNETYCESKLIQEFTIDLLETTGTAHCTGYPSSCNLTNVEGVLNTVQKTYTKESVIDFGATTFSGVGDCIFVIYPKDDTTNDNKYKIAIHVNSDVNSNNVATGDIRAKIWAQKEKVSTGDKIENLNIVVENPNTYIKIDKQVKGDIADLSKDFIFNVKIDGYTGDTYTVVKPDSTTDTYTVARTGTEVTGVNYTIGHNENLTIGKNGTTMQIPVGTNYTITETSDGYTTTYKYINRAGATEQTGAEVTGVAMKTDTDNEVKFINTKNAEATTGVFYNVLPFVAVILLAVVGIILMKKTNKK